MGSPGAGKGALQRWDPEDAQPPAPQASLRGPIRLQLTPQRLPAALPALEGPEVGWGQTLGTNPGSTVN